MLRRMTEHLTRDWVVRRRLPSDFARVPFHVSPSAGLRYLFRPMDTVDPILLNLVKEFVGPGSVVWDVGANVGLFAFAAYNAGPGRIQALREEAAKKGLNPNLWINNVELVAAARIGMETVTYVANIYKY